MKYPLFIFHELIIRLAEINPKIGDFSSFLPHDETYTLITDKGSLIVPTHFLQMQFENPALINQTDLGILAQNFRLKS
ncbi:MAG: hypothetical protein EOO42_01030 [Flavobacteriales bacterium]|nr:MAG: hypothetical protein EOO42_01030 [Flavobacteriales bacterium]